MTPKRWTKWANLGLAVIVGGGTIFGLSQSLGPVPAFSQAFNPSTGVWTTAKEDQLMPKTEDLRIAGLDQSVQIVFEEDGTPHIKAETNRDAWMALGYLHAKFRLTQMDLMRRQGAGLLSEVLGATALESDKLQRQLGLTRTANEEWQSLEPGSPTREVLQAYADGINEVIKKQNDSNQLPLLFKLFGYKPQPWQPQDTLVLKGVLAQMMSLTSMPVSMALLSDTLGEERAMELFPVLPPNEQYPFDTGPYERHDLAEMPLSAEHYYMKKSGQDEPTVVSSNENKSQNLTQVAMQKSITASALSVLSRFESLPPQAIHEDSNSNAWIVGGQKTESGKPLLAGDPHLSMTLPSIWYQMEMEAPDYQVSGVTVPGIPFPLIGRNEHISWSMTNGQTQQSFFYKEQMDEAHPDQYYWQGAWRKLQHTVEEIAVKGSAPVQLDIAATVHGPIIDKDGHTLALNWLGAIPSQLMDGLRQVTQAHNYEQFQSALHGWGAPTMNMAYADQAGNIGMITAGYIPVFEKDAKPWLPMKGDGTNDFIGRVPFADLPQVYNPPEGIIGSANQRQVGEDYPYYIGNTMQFEGGYRSKRIYEKLSEESKLTAADMVALQADVKDTLAASIVPKLQEVLAKSDLTTNEQAAVDALASWNFEADEKSVAASVWITFWEKYMHLTFDPHWEHYKVPDIKTVKVSPARPGLNQVLQVWTLSDPQNHFFTDPRTGEKRDANTVMLQAFQATVADLGQRLGGDVSTWTWERIHSRKLLALSKLEPLGYGPRGAEGDYFTLNVAGEFESTHGPSWRMVTDWGTGQSIGSYPGGQSENPLSPWYADRIESWWNVEHRPLISFPQAAANENSVRWTLTPPNE